MLFIISTILLVICWIFGDQSLFVKLAFTAASIASLGFLATEEYQSLFHATQFILILSVGISTLGIDWLTQSVR